MEQPTTPGELAVEKLARWVITIGALTLAGATLCGCAGTGVNSGAVATVAGAITDAELYHRSKVDGDKAMRGNLRDAWHELAATKAELRLVTEDQNGAVPTETALEIVRQLGDRMKLAGAKLEEIAEKQAAAEVHYQGLRGILSATVGLMKALAERDQAEQAANARTVEGIRAGGEVFKKNAARAVTGGVGP